MGNTLTAIDLNIDLFQGIRQLPPEILVHIGRIFRQIQKNLPLRQDDGEGVVDFVSDTCRELSKRGHLPRFHELLVQLIRLSIAFSNHRDQVPGHKNNDD